MNEIMYLVTIRMLKTNNKHFY